MRGAGTFRKNTGGSRRVRAFTLLEIIAALALVAMLSLAAIASLPRDFGKNVPIEKAFETAVRAASYLAQERGAYLALSFDRRGFFEISEVETGRAVKRVFLKDAYAKVVEAALKDGREILQPETECTDSVVFEPNLPEIIGRTKLDFPESFPQRIVFAPDGTCGGGSVKITSQAFEQPLALKLDWAAATVYESGK